MSGGGGEGSSEIDPLSYNYQSLDKEFYYKQDIKQFIQHLWN